MIDKPRNQMIDVTFFKRTGKFYANTHAIVNHYIFEEGFKRDIVSTQNALVDGWQGDFIVVTSAPKHVNGFFEGLFYPEEFEGIKKEAD